MQLRKKRNKSKKGASVAFLNWRFGLTKDDRLEDCGGARPGFIERGYPTKAIITIPITLYGYGNGDNAEQGSPEGCAVGWSMGSTRPTKPVAVAV
jgi:hypothetical protein